MKISIRGGERNYLTPREVEILEMCADDLSPNEIAYKLGISIRTVRHHLQHARDALKKRTTCAAVIDFSRRRKEVYREVALSLLDRSSVNVGRRKDPTKIQNGESE